MKLFEGYSSKGKLLSHEEYMQKQKNDFSKKIQQLDKQVIDILIERADKALTAETPMMYVSGYRMFVENGNRNIYEDAYHERRGILLDLTMGYMVSKDDKYIKRAIDLLWLILEESVWVVPAHNRSGSSVLFEYDDITYLDIHTGATAATVALVYFLLKDKLDENVSNKVISGRVVYELEKRVLKPFEKYATKWWYVGYIPGHKINNWNPWVMSNILFVNSIIVSDNERKENITDLLMKYSDNFIDTYQEDGGCDEGPSYWGAAGASYFDFLDLLYDMSDGNISKWDEALVYNMADYIRKMYIGNGYYVNFADCVPKVEKLERNLIYRFAQATGNEKMMQFACTLKQNYKMGYFHPQRSFLDLFVNIDCDKLGEYIPNEKEVMNDTQIYSFRKDDMFLSVKGGHNRESHNHNDVGHFVLYTYDMPVIIDTGADTYSRITFSDERYSLWYMNSSYHNLPDIAGAAQLPGSMYKAMDVQLSECGNKVDMQLKNAYPEDIGLKSYTRTVESLEDSFVITDNIQLDNDKGSVGHLMMLDEPVVEQLDENTKAVMSEDTVISIQGMQDVTVEKVSILNTAGIEQGQAEYGVMANSWQREHIFRVNIHNSGSNIVVKYTISRRK